MFRVFSQHRRFSAPRRAAAVLMALVLNVTLVPCTMAVEAAADGHDCCPPEIRLDPSDCCVVDDAAHDARSARFSLDDDGGFDVPPGPGHVHQALPDPAAGPEATGPPLRAYRTTPVYKLNCAYLK